MPIPAISWQFQGCKASAAACIYESRRQALRSFTNVGLTALEELEDLNDVIGNREYKTKPKAQKKAAPKTKASAPLKRLVPANLTFQAILTI